LRERPTTTAKIITTYTPGTILDNLGCQRADGRIWCDVQQLGGGPRGYVAAEFLTPAVSPDGSVATGPDNSAYRAGQGDFDATGQIPCAQYPGQPMTECEFGVARAGGGYATVVILLPGEILTGCGMSEVTKTTLAKTESTTSRFGTSAREETKSSSANPLAGTRWQLLEI
jgi:hypothetical protein